MKFSCTLCGSRDWPSENTDCPLCRKETPTEKTMNTQHTPGPWNIHEYYADPEVLTVPEDKSGMPPYDFCQTYVAQGTKVIAQVQMQTGEGGWPHVESRDEMLANARLIAAAPELLEAAMEAVLFPSSPATPKLRAAIAKAKGETP